MQASTRRFCHDGRLKPALRKSPTNPVQVSSVCPGIPHGALAFPSERSTPTSRRFLERGKPILAAVALPRTKPRKHRSRFQVERYEQENPRVAGAKVRGRPVIQGLRAGASEASAPPTQRTLTRVRWSIERAEVIFRGSQFGRPRRFPERSRFGRREGLPNEAKRRRSRFKIERYEEENARVAGAEASDAPESRAFAQVSEDALRPSHPAPGPGVRWSHLRRQPTEVVRFQRRRYEFEPERDSPNEANSLGTGFPERSQKPPKSFSDANAARHRESLF